MLATWSDYLPAVATGALPGEPRVFTYLVGPVEIVAGLVAPSRNTAYGAYLVAGWLLAVAAVLAAGGRFDVVDGDLVMAVGGVSLAHLVAAEDAA